MHLLLFSCKKDISDIIGLDIETYKLKRFKLNSASTVNRQVTRLKRIPKRAGVDCKLTSEMFLKQ